MTDTDHLPFAPRPYHHGKSPAAWVTAVGVFVGIVVAAVGFWPLGPPVHWVVFVVGVGIIVVATIAGLVMARLGLGNGS